MALSRGLVCSAVAFVAVASPWESEVTFDFSSPADVHAGLPDGDTIILTSFPGNPGEIKVGLECSADDWWKAVTQFDGDSFVHEVVEVHQKGKTNYGVISSGDLGHDDFVLSKAKAFGVHTNLYHIKNAKDMKPGMTYMFTWAVCDDYAAANKTSTASLSPATEPVATTANCPQIIKTKPPASCPGDKKCCANLFGHTCCDKTATCISGMGFTPPRCYGESATEPVAATANCPQIIKTKPPASCPGDKKCCANLFGHTCCDKTATCISGMGFTPLRCYGESATGANETVLV